MRGLLAVLALTFLLSISANAQNQRPATMSPYYNVLHDDSTTYRHVVTEQYVHPAPGQSYAAWGSGFVLGGTGGHHHYSYNAPGGYHYHGRFCVWIEGHYEPYVRTVWVPAHYEQQYVPPVYATQVLNGLQVVVLVSEGHYEQVFVPSYYTTVTESRWVPGYWSCGY
ncbi:MAG: hypothetical protein IT364_13830 [Candidatus Hydrogenedentes bacterium]|nr:hypothetical protein [Candidatus Hydrogenedentota bacterium]